MDENGCDRDLGPESGLLAWLHELRQNSEYSSLAIAALRGDVEARNELKYRFPWADCGPAQRWAEITCAEVQRLVELALSTPVDGSELAQLRFGIDVRSALHAAQFATTEQTKALVILAARSE